eukprot:5410546-Prymnesium_polylepis.1
MEISEVDLNLTRNNVGDEGAQALYRAMRKRHEAAKDASRKPPVEPYSNARVCLADCNVSAAFK